MLRLFVLLIGCTIVLSQNCTEKYAVPVNSDKYYREVIPRTNGYHINYMDKYNFFEAFEYCSYNKMQLATFNARYEECVFEKVLDKLNWRGKDITLWISGSNLGVDKNRDYVWMSSGELFRYKNWGPGQPDNNGGNEHCVEWDNYNRNWNDKDCYRHQGLICEDRCELNPAPTDKDCL